MLFTYGGKNSSIAKRRQLRLGAYLAKLTPSKYPGPQKVSACWSNSIYARQLSLMNHSASDRASQSVAPDSWSNFFPNEEPSVLGGSTGPG